MKKWKERIFAGMMAAALILSGIATTATEVKAEETPGYLQSKVLYNGQKTYVAYNDAFGDRNVFTWTGQGDTAEPNQFYDFRLVDEEKSIYMLISTADASRGKALSVSGTDVGSGVVIARTDESDTKQQWQMEETEDEEGYFRVKSVASGYYLTTPRTSEQDELDWQYLTVKAADDSESQMWTTDTSVQMIQPQEPGDVPSQDTVKSHLASKANDGTSNQYLGVKGGSTAAGEELLTWTGPEPNQQWQFAETEEDSKVYRIMNTNSGLAVTAQNMREGSCLVQQTVSEDQKQLWTFIETSKGVYRIRNVETHLYLTADVKYSASRILQKNWMESDLQLWKMDEGVLVHTQDPITDYAVKIWVTDGIQVTSSQGAAVEKGEDVTVTVTPREGYEVKDMKLFINEKEQKLTQGEGNSMVCTVANVQEDLLVQARGDVTTLNGYVCIPEDDYPGRNQCLSPRVVEGTDGTLYATFENGTPSQIEEGEYSFPIYESKDKGETWKRVGEIVNDDKVHPDAYYRIDSY